MFTHLHVRSWFSFLAGGSSPHVLAQRARSLGMNALALTDVNGLYGVVGFQKACRAEGIHSIIGADVVVAGQSLVLLAKTHLGYQNLCLLLTRAHLNNRNEPSSDIDEIAKHCNDLICLTGGREGFLWHLTSQKKILQATAWLQTLSEIFPDDLYVELTHSLSPGDKGVIHKLAQMAQVNNLPVVASNDVRYATQEDYRRYDLLSCIRLGIPVTQPHELRPSNAEAYLKTEDDLRKLIPWDDAFGNTELIANQCHVNLVPEHIIPPSASIPKGETSTHYLGSLCRTALPQKYLSEEQSEAKVQLEKELSVISDLQLEEFFLVVHEVTEKARHWGIRCAGRGSAANSIVAYLLGITAVDPIRYNLLFERFLHRGRKGTPDIDIDFDSDRRNEIIAWMEEHFGIEQTAMTATIITYRLRMALREVAKALGWPMPIVDDLSKKVPSSNARDIRKHREQLATVIGESPLFELLLDMVEHLDGCPRHIGQHSGGMILSRKKLSHFTPIQFSANNVKLVQFDKDDIEAMGLVKLDVLGLRMLACLSEAVELVSGHERKEIDLDRLPLDDPKVFELIRSGKTLALFQIESMGQMHLIAKNQPETFDDLIAEIALFRPGPLQGGMVHPFVKRRRGEEPVVYDHPDLETLLEDTYGVILFQEQILEIAHQFAGMSLEEADDFRTLISKHRDPVKMQEMRVKFVDGAVARGVPCKTANTVFDKASHFVGYGFCRSHAAAFAKTVYHSAWMKCYHPAAYMAAFMQHRPGFYNQMTLEEESRRLGINVLYPTINKSGTRFDLERQVCGKLSIRKPLTAIKEISEEIAQQIVWSRLHGPFKSTEDLISRVWLPRDVLDALAKAGTLDSLANNSRKALWETGVLAQRCKPTPHDVASLIDVPTLSEKDIPQLPALTQAEQLSWDYKTQSAGRMHPITLARRHLNDLDIQPINSIYRIIPVLDSENSRGPLVTLAGIVIVRQKPGTAKGFIFLSIEDESGFVQCIVHPTLQKRYYNLLSQPSLIVRGELQATGNWRALLLKEAWPLEGIFGGYAGFASANGNQTRIKTELKSSEPHIMHDKETSAETPMTEAV